MNNKRTGDEICALYEKPTVSAAEACEMAITDTQADKIAQVLERCSQSDTGANGDDD
ncbi:hypothetical protein [Shewanella maritima]|uniref:hypothetical protein n=1 Tax=Shewanella maritima TaxID=2520507 RepID=UPI0013EECE09|nr:hypothetical protein [Shewanella maritima]